MKSITERRMEHESRDRTTRLNNHKVVSSGKGWEVVRDERPMGQGGGSTYKAYTTAGGRNLVDTFDKQAEAEKAAKSASVGSELSRLSDEKTEGDSKPAAEVKSGDTVPKESKSSTEETKPGGEAAASGSAGGTPDDTPPAPPDPKPKTPEEMRSINPNELIEPQDPNKANGEQPAGTSEVPKGDKTQEEGPREEAVKMYAADPEITQLMSNLSSTSSSLMSDLDDLNDAIDRQKMDGKVCVEEAKKILTKAKAMSGPEKAEVVKYAERVLGYAKDFAYEEEQND